MKRNAYFALAVCLLVAVCFSGCHQSASSGEAQAVAGASLGLAFVDDDRFGATFQGGAFVGQHGSWNRKPPAGCRVIFIPFRMSSRLENRSRY